MAVEPPANLSVRPINRTKMMFGAVDKQSDANVCLGYRPAHPLSGTTTAETLPPMYSSAFSIPDLVKADSELTYNLPVSRKRSRYCSSICAFSGDEYSYWNQIDHCDTFTFLGDDISSQIQQQEFEIDQFVARHNEEVRMQIKEKRRRNSMKLIAALEEGATQRLRAKEDEIMKMMKLNCALEDKVKSMCIENQIWRELALTNEATANALRSNLKQVLEQVVHGNFRHHNTQAGEDDAAVALADDAQSCCESNKGNELILAEQDSSNSHMNRWCRRCGEAESSVLLLPCRHLCLCTVCVSSVDICPICKSAKNISVHVHMS
ncbi:hypothetical protein R6Q59_015702 [Mikania micrantha]|uniref:RING-type domain-containing protein n=1 Tax=Mikania micrantha TaxID=192012 RepID=A0A5N6PGS7_9ASTR|nr:hypothetical protein E3N88_08645 [Mikania micrantha]